MRAAGKFTRHTVEALQPGEVVWDGAVAGFGARRQSGTPITYVLKYRTTDGRQRFHRLGRHGSRKPCGVQLTLTQPPRPSAFAGRRQSRERLFRRYRGWTCS